MSTTRYFENFPKINYSNNTAIDLTIRIAPLDKLSNNPYIFYPYDLSTFERPDHFSHRYYDDSYKSWILYLTNKIIDPYYEWYLQQDELGEMITDKYGDFYWSQQKIKYYQNDWADKTAIAINVYDALPGNLKKYWEPVYGTYENIISYKRKQINWTIATNQIVCYFLNNVSGFIKDEICDIEFDQVYSGKGQIYAIDTDKNLIYVHHTSGTTVPTTNEVAIGSKSVIKGKESNSVSNFTDVKMIVQNITDEETIYWKGVTYFEYEYFKNENTKTIQVLDNRYSPQIVKELKNLLKV